LTDTTLVPSPADNTETKELSGVRHSPVPSRIPARQSSRGRASPGSRRRATVPTGGQHWFESVHSRPAVRQAAPPPGRKTRIRLMTSTPPPSPSARASRRSTNHERVGGSPARLGAVGYGAVLRSLAEQSPPACRR
jgi:hypothetical protein